METETQREDKELVNGNMTKNKKMLYTVTETPSWHICVLLGLQQCLTALNGCFGLPLLIAPHICLTGDNIGISELVGTVVFISGVGTLLQTCFGIRLPIIQGPSAAFITPLISLMALPEWRCLKYNFSDNQTLPQAGSDEHRTIWKLRIAEVQGDVMVASSFQILLGFSGLMSFLLTFIGPLTVAPTIAIIGLSLFELAINMSSSQWWIALLTTALIVVFSQCLAGRQIPCIGWNRKDGFFRVGLPIFTLFPILLTLVISWIVCLILTETGVFSEDPQGWGYRARTDIKADVLSKSQWFRFPYPGQWGPPTVSLAGAVGMVGGALASMIESVGDYYACARISGAPPPPGSAVSRGLFTEGIGGLLAGALGTGGGTTSYSQNIGAIGITKVGSRTVVMVAGVFLIMLGCLGKVGALFVTMPEPVIGGMFMVMFGMVTGVGLSNLHFVDLTSVRNLLVLGLSLFLGLGIPRWINANADKINTGSEIADQLLCVVLGTNMIVAGVTSCFLDNTLPGTAEERGITKWRQETDVGSSEERNERRTKTVYDIPFIQKYLNRWTCAKYIPILPRSVLDRKNTNDSVA